MPRKKVDKSWLTPEVIAYYKDHTARETCDHFGLEYNYTHQRRLSAQHPKGEYEIINITDKMIAHYLEGATWKDVAKRFRKTPTDSFRKALVKAAGAKKGKGKFDRNIPTITDEMIAYYRSGYTFLEMCEKFQLKGTRGLQNRFAKIGKSTYE